MNARVKDGLFFQLDCLSCCLGGLVADSVKMNIFNGDNRRDGNVEHLLRSLTLNIAFSSILMLGRFCSIFCNFSLF